MILFTLAITDEFRKILNNDFLLANLIDEFYSVKSYLYQSITYINVSIALIYTYIRMVERSLRN